LNEKNRTYDNGSLYYENGFLKAAYGSFIEGLDVIFCSDLCADIAAARFNVTWERTSPMVMSVRDDNVRTIMSGESSFYFGRTAYGDPDAVKAFYFACSASFSPIEHYVATALFLRNSDNSSVTIGLGFILDNGGTIEIVQEGNFTLIRELGSNEKVLVFDASTGLLHDQMQVIYGAFCYSNQQTDWAYDLGSELLNNFGPIWDYLCSNWDLPNLSLPATNFLKSANLFLGFGSLFVVEVAELTGTLTGIGGLISGIGVGSLATACLFALPVLFISIEPVGEPDGYVENYWDWNYPSHDDPYVVYPDNVVQVKNNKRYTEDKYELYNSISNELNFFHWGNSVPSGDNGGNGSIFKTILIITTIPYIWGTYYIGEKVLKGLTSEHKIKYIKLEFNERTNKTEVIIYY